MASAISEATPLIPATSGTAPTPARRTVTFTPDTRLGTSPSDAPTPARQPQRMQRGSSGGGGGSSSTGASGPPQGQPSQPLPGQPMLSSLNSKLRRRNSHGAPVTGPALPISKIGPQRTTKNAQKLKLLPNPDHGDEGPDEESGRDVYSQFTRIKDPSARRDAARLGKADRARLPRVTAYCTASGYRMEGLMRFLKGRAKTRGAAPKQFDECIYSPYDYSRGKNPAGGFAGTDGQEEDALRQRLGQSPREAMKSRRQSDSALLIGDGPTPDADLIGEVLDEQGQRVVPSVTSGAPMGADLPSSAGTSLGLMSSTTSHQHEQQQQQHHGDSSAIASSSSAVDLDTKVHIPEVFLFEYGTVVVWGMTLQQEERFLKELAKFETEKLSADDVQTENFNFYYTSEYQARVYNDFISLRDKRNHMTKLAISHALAQSVKTSLYEDLLSTTIEETTPFPNLLATTGSISLSRREINQKIGELFILRINIHLQGSVLDSPELMWAEPQLEPVYGAVRSYLEMDQRVSLMNERLNVLGDLLAVLKDQVGTKHGEYLEWIVIVLIAAEILVAAVNIVVDLYAGVD